MLIPSIDLSAGRTVQWIGGAVEALELGDPRPYAERFGRGGEVAVVDLDAALGKGDHEALIRADLLHRAPCRVGGGIRDLARARRWLDAGAQKIILGTAATPELLSQLPTERVQAALDVRGREVVVKGWTESTGADVFDRIAELRPFVGGFLVTAVEREGRKAGIDLDFAKALAEAAGPRKVTLAGGVRSAEDVAALHALGLDAQVGMALYEDDLDEAACLGAILRQRTGSELWPTLVCDPSTRALGLAWSDEESLRVALREGVGAYHSRRRGLWIKGESSGATQSLLRCELDCDSDALRFTVEQSGLGFCHRDTPTCFGEGANRGQSRLEKTLIRRRSQALEGSYTARLFEEPGLLEAKLREEAVELAQAAAEGRRRVVEEAADLTYFLQCALVRAGASLRDLEDELDRRALRLSRRGGDAKAEVSP